MTTSDTLWEDANYRARVSLLAAKVNASVATRAEAEEYRAHIVIFRLDGGIGEEMAERAIRMADKCPGAIQPCLGGMPVTLTLSMDTPPQRR